MFPSKSCLVCFSIIFVAAILPACGNRFDLATDRGRQARIDDANFHLSNGECSAAHAAIDPVYSSPQVDDEVRIVKASAYACDGGFSLLTVAANLSGTSNYFKALAKSMDNTAGDSKRSAMYNAIDVLTESGSKLNATQRTARVNTYMVFLQMGSIGVILRNYGAPAADGTQGTAISYVANGADGVGEMTTLDACALTAAFANISDSYSRSTLSDGDTAAVNNSLNASCVAAGLASCAVANKDRTLCTGAGADPNSAAAANVVTQVDSGW